jgi:hypothetical protein
MAKKLLTTKQVSAIRKYMKEKAASLAPNHIKKHIGAVVTSRTDGWSIKWIVNVHEDGQTADAAAQEYGSGLYGAEKKKYIIAPKKPGGVLAFSWEVADHAALQGNINRRMGDARRAGMTAADARRDGSKFYGFGTGGKLLFNWVEHPGIRPYKGRGYLGEAMRLGQNEISDMVLKGAKDGLVKEIYQAFRFRRHT